MLTATTVPTALPRRRSRPRPARAVLTGLATAARFAGHFAMAAVSVAVVGTEH
jgi:hypothetical protein